jgi:hypothetical protein
MAMVAICITLIVYDYILTFAQEIEFIWLESKPWNAIKVAFIVQRYLPFLDVVLVGLLSEF